MNDRLKIELWEIQLILYLILAQLVQDQTIKVLIYIWCIIVATGILVVGMISYKKDGR